MKKLSLIVPMYNEEEMIPLFFEKIEEVLNQIKDYTKEIVCVNDGSRDKTLELLKEYKKKIMIFILFLFLETLAMKPLLLQALNVRKVM